MLLFTKKCVKAYCEKVADNGIAANKAFWKFIKPFLKRKVLVKKDLVKTYNKHYIIVEHSSGLKPYNLTLGLPKLNKKQKRLLFKIVLSAALKNDTKKATGADKIPP